MLFEKNLKKERFSCIKQNFFWEKRKIPTTKNDIFLD